LIILVGQEGTGKTTLVRALRPALQHGAVLDGEDVGQVNPWVYDEAFRDLHRRNVAALVRNFWDAGYGTVVAGSFLAAHQEYGEFRSLLPADIDVTVVQLLVRKDVRDARRNSRAKVTTQEWRDAVDEVDVQDTAWDRTGAGYAYVAVDTSDLGVAETVQHLTAQMLGNGTSGTSGG
jgi:ABC-type cobalamin/Fe3+-siderophores transport system ATPase subunit